MVRDRSYILPTPDPVRLARVGGPGTTRLPLAAAAAVILAIGWHLTQPETAAARSIADFERADAAGAAIDCAALVSGAHVPDLAVMAGVETERGYRFRQCRAEIDSQQADRCPRIARELRVWQDGRDKRDPAAGAQQRAGSGCASYVREAFADFRPRWSVRMAREATLVLTAGGGALVSVPLASVHIEPTQVYAGALPAVRVSANAGSAAWTVAFADEGARQAALKVVAWAAADDAIGQAHQAVIEEAAQPVTVTASRVKVGESGTLARP